jgi:hypothetical protein
MTKRCGKCEHYTPAKWDEGFGDCDLMDDANDGKPDSTRAYGWDYEGYRAGVYVGVNFGCIHWMKKEQHKGESK